MRWSKSALRNSIFGWISPASEMPSVNPEARMEDIRHAMLSCLAESDDDAHVVFGRKLRAATDIDTLWYSRNELMQLISHRVGEQQARERLVSITTLFVGLLADNLVHANRKPKTF